MWQEERDPPTCDPEECSHRRTDHRGSTKELRRTFCLDCGTYVDEVSQEIHKGQELKKASVTQEEYETLFKMSNHSMISREQAMI